MKIEIDEVNLNWPKTPLKLFNLQRKSKMEDSTLTGNAGGKTKQVGQHSS